MNKLLLTIFLTFNIFSLFGQNTPKYSNEFLAVGVGARGIAMSNTQSAIADDGN